MTQSKHTPTPWQVEGCIIEHKDQHNQTDLQIDLSEGTSNSIKTDKANAAFIVTACNNHEKLVSQLNVLHEWVRHHHPAFIGSGHDTAILETLKEAEGR